MIMLQLTLMIIIMGNAYGLKVRDFTKTTFFPHGQVIFLSISVFIKKILLNPKSAYLFDIMHKQIILLCLKWKKTSFWYTVEALSYKILRRVIKDISQLCFFFGYSTVFCKDDHFSSNIFWCYKKIHRWDDCICRWCVKNHQYNINIAVWFTRQSKLQLTY